VTTLVRRFLFTFVFTFILVGTSVSGVALRAQEADSTNNNLSQDDPLKRPRPAKKKPAEDRAFKNWRDEVASIITPEEEAAFRKLTNDAERQNFVELFWQHRDPTPDTSENEYKEEFYRRKAYAMEHFAAGKPGDKTDRGRMYIIHGRPDSIEAHPAGGPYQRTAEEGGGPTQTFPFEMWRYRHIDGIGDEIEIEFVDSCGCGGYHMTLDRGEKDVSNHVPGMAPTTLEAAGRASQADRAKGPEHLGKSLFDPNRETKEFDRMREQALMNAPPAIKMGAREGVSSTIRNLLPFDYRVDFVKAPEEKAVVPITIQVANSVMTYVSKDGVQHAAVDIQGLVTTLTGKTVQSFHEPLRLDVAAEALGNFVGGTSRYQKALVLAPGRYKLELILKDVNGDKLGLMSRALNVPDYAGDQVASSTLIIADLIEPVAARDIGAGNFVLGAMKVRPRVATGGAEEVEFQRGQRVSVWMEVYHLGDRAAVEYEVKNAVSGQIVVFNTESAEIRGNQATLAKNLPPDVLLPGEYQVTVKVTGASGQTLAQSAKFAVR